MQAITATDPVAEAQRRESLHKLDSVLNQLEALHMKDVKVLSDVTATKLREAGISLPNKGHVTVTSAIEAVWKMQESYMLKGQDEKTKRKRRSKAEIAAAAANSVSV